MNRTLSPSVPVNSSQNTRTQPSHFILSPASRTTVICVSNKSRPLTNRTTYAVATKEKSSCSANIRTCTWAVDFVDDVGRKDLATGISVSGNEGGCKQGSEEGLETHGDGEGDTTIVNCLKREFRCGVAVP